MIPLAALLEPLDWQTKAACRDLDPSYWFADTGHKGTTRAEGGDETSRHRHLPTLRSQTGMSRLCDVHQPAVWHLGWHDRPARRALRRGAA